MNSLWSSQTQSYGCHMKRLNIIVPALSSLLKAEDINKLSGIKDSVDGKGRAIYLKCLGMKSFRIKDFYFFVLLEDGEREFSFATKTLQGYWRFRILELKILYLFVGFLVCSAFFLNNGR